MALSPHEKLRALEDVLKKKEQEKKTAEQTAKRAEQELKTLKAALRAEQEEALIEEELAQKQPAKKREEEPEEPQKEETPFSIDDLVADAPKNQQLGGALYSLQERMRSGMNLYEMTLTAQALTDLRQEGALTQNQYNILNQFEDQLRERGVQTGYSNQQQLYAQQATNRLEQLKQNVGVQIGGQTYGSNDFTP